jgi:hypothetical protein
MILRQLLHLIARRVRQRSLVVEHRAEIADVEPSAAEFTFPKMFGFGQRRSAGQLADDCPTWDFPNLASTHPIKQK